MIVLDTHALVWWLHNPDDLSPKAYTAIEKAGGSLSMWPQ